MADAPVEKKNGLTMVEQIMIAFFVLYALSLLYARVNEFFLYYHGGGFSSIWAALVSYFYTHVVPVVEILAIIVSASAVWGIFLAYNKLSAIAKEERDIYGAKSPAEDAAAPAMKNERWERVIAHINSVSSSDWRLAIIEADVMLDELLKTLGMPGDSLGERLKAVEKSDMLTLDNAWEAHRVRNQVAHQGTDFPLSEREAKRAISLYESVFREYKII